MKYISTRGNSPAIDFEQAATCGLAMDGGLYVPEQWPSFSPTELRSLAGRAYDEVAFAVLHKFAGDSVPPAALRQAVTDAYANFHHPDIAPLREIGTELYLLELFHGPTFSFKDYALQFLGQLMDWSLKRRNRHLTIIGATSGDTGSAAISAITGRHNIDLYMLHPFQRISDIQRRQMTTNQAGNIYNYAVDGNFDDCQSMVKNLLSDREVQRVYDLGAVNSINWVRVAAQVAYYCYAALKLGAPDTTVSFAVPTGNFGNVFAAWTARKMGLPIRQLTVCSNANDILTRFFETGEMKKQGVKKTVTPSMDIEIASNFERFLFELYARDGTQIAKLMENLKRTGRFKIDSRKLHLAHQHFYARRVNDAETCAGISSHYEATGEIIDPHTAVALSAIDPPDADETIPTVVVATAHPAKFPDIIKRTLKVPVPMPTRLRDLMDLPERYRRIANHPQQLKTLILTR